MKRLEFLLVLLCGLLLVPCASAFQHAHDEDLPDLDKRKGKAGTFEPARKAAAERLKENLPNARIELDEITGAPKFVSTPKGFLSGKNGLGRGISTNAIAAQGKNEPHRVTKNFLREHKELFGHGPEALQEARVKRDYVTPHNGMKTTVWQQELDGIPVFEALFVSHVTKDEELVNVSSRFIATPAQAADRGVKHRQSVVAQPSITPKRAIILAASHLGTEVTAAEIDELGFDTNEPRRQKFKSTGIPKETYAELVWLPVSAIEMKLCWQIILTRPGHGDVFLLLVDAQAGEVLLRRGLTRDISDASYNVFTVESPTPLSPGNSTPITNQPPLAARELVTLAALSTNASPLGWINDGGNETIGNNVEAHLDRNGDNVADLPRPQGSPVRVFDGALDLSQSPATYGDASVIQVFYWCNWMHDKLYELGFTEPAGNFQQTNFLPGGIGGDPVMADAQDRYSDALSRNLARFTTLPDGISGHMQLQIYSRSGSQPDRDPGFDAHIVLHEYTHGLSDRLVGGGAGMTQSQSRGMGEGWSDFYALALLSNPTNDVDAVYPWAAYVSQKFFPASLEYNYYYGMRRYPYSTDLTKNPLTFKDIDPFQVGTYPSVPRSPSTLDFGSASAVHNQGEVWCVTLWEARANLIKKHGFAPGNQLMLQLVTDAMKLCPPNPNFLQARDAILQADEVNNGGTNHPELWAAFAKRGMGTFATSPPSNTTIGVVESFALPDNLSIRPDAGLMSSGPSGGPFLPNAQSFALSNIGPETITWSLQNVASWLNVSSLGGSLMSSNGVDIDISIKQSVAGSLPAGIYTNTVVFTNETSGIAQFRRFVLRIGQPDDFTDVFELNDFDLAYQSFTFTPDDSSSFYKVCRQTVTNFPSDSTGGTFVPLSDDDSKKITVPANVAYYGNSTMELYIGSNGYITFGFADSNHVETLTAHFGLPRISALFNDLEPPTNSISWKTFTNRVAVTYSNVTEWGTFKSNTFQIELFYDSRIRITYLNMGTRNGLVGLSRGTGVPADFVESAFSSYSECAPALQVTIPAFTAEEAGSVSGQISIHAPLTTNLTISLFSSDNSQATVPSQIILPAEETSVPFTISVVDDEFLDGTQPVTIRAAASGYEMGRATIRIDDNEAAALLVILPDFATEGEGTILGSVFIQDAAVAADVEVQLESLTPSRLTVASSVIIPAGQSSASFEMTVLNNDFIDGNSTGTITASVTGWSEGTGNVSILDDENRNLRLQVPNTVREGNGILPQSGSVHISGKWTEDLIVGLTSDSASALSLPAFILIPAGSTFVTFDLNVGDDSFLDGEQSVQLTAFATEFVTDQQMVTVQDDETPAPASNPRPVDMSLSNPVIVSLEWDPSLDEGTERLSNGGFESGSATGWTLHTNGNNSFTVFSGNYSTSEVGTHVTPCGGGYALAATQTQAGTQTLIRQLTLPEYQVVTLSWADLIAGVPGEANSNDQFRVELRDTNDMVVSVLFSTPPVFSFSGEWTKRSFNISQFGGETVRLAFVVQTTAPGFTVLLDDISIRSATPPLTTYDVYFGTNATLNGSHLVGSTTNPFWDLPVLSPFSTYFWKIVSRRIGEASSPVWQFSTVPTLSLEDVALSEGDSNLVSAIFTLNLSTPSSDLVAVDYTTIARSAFAGEDFVPTNGVIEFAPGETNKTIVVSIVGDTNFEEHETFALVLSNPQNAAVARPEAICTILDDDSILAPISDKTINENALLTFTALAGSPGVALTQTITDFESFPLTSENGTVLFREPRLFSSIYLNSDLNVSQITNNFPVGHAGSQVLAVTCNFNSTPNGWLRLTTASAAALPNPTISFNQAIQFDFYTDREVKLGLGVRETGTTNAIGADGGNSGTIEFIGVTNKIAGPNTPRPVRTITAGSWQRIAFNVPAEAITNMTGNGVLDQSTGKGVLEHLGIVPNAGTGIYHFYLDNFAVVYTNQLTFSLSNAPAGATINPYTGQFSWTPTEAQGPGVYTIGVNATDGASVNEWRVFSVTVKEVNSTPTLSAISNKTITELTTLSYSAVAVDSDFPTNTLTYSLDSAPTGAGINPSTGLFTWTPSEIQGPSTNTVTIRVTDNGSPNLTTIRTFFVFVTEVNNVPVLAPITDRLVYPNTSLILSANAFDHDQPANTLTFSLIGTPPPGASINPSTGLFTWPAIAAPAGSSTVITIRVQDNGTPTLGTSQSFNVIVVSPPVLQANLTEEGFEFSWAAIPGHTYRIEYTASLIDPEWVTLGDLTAENNVASLTDALSQQGLRFYRILTLP